MGKVGKIYREGLKQSIRRGVEGNKSVFLLNYSEISSSQMDDLRKELKKLGASVYVSKNRIAKIALQELDQENLAEKIAGQTAFAWSNEDSVEISKALMKFSTACSTMRVSGGLLDGALLEEGDVKRLSDLPSKDVLRAQLLGTIIAPLTRLAGILNGKTQELLSILKQYSEKKGGN